ncbi:MAG: hypothetical protein ABEI52_08560, partial [Halobacteriaceae archaeon]
MRMDCVPRTNHAFFFLFAARVAESRCLFFSARGVFELSIPVVHYMSGESGGDTRTRRTLTTPALSLGRTCVTGECLDADTMRGLKQMTAQIHGRYDYMTAKADQLHGSVMERMDALSDAQQQAFEQLNVRMRDKHDQFRAGRSGAFASVGRALEAQAEELGDSGAARTSRILEDAEARYAAMREARGEALARLESDFAGHVSASAEEKQKLLEDLTQKVMEERLARRGVAARGGDVTYAD